MAADEPCPGHRGSTAFLSGAPGKALRGGARGCLERADARRRCSRQCGGRCESAASQRPSWKAATLCVSHLRCIVQKNRCYRSPGVENVLEAWSPHLPHWSFARVYHLCRRPATTLRIRCGERHVWTDGEHDANVLVGPMRVSATVRTCECGCNALCVTTRTRHVSASLAPHAHCSSHTRRRLDVEVRPWTRTDHTPHSAVSYSAQGQCAGLPIATSVIELLLSFQLGPDVPPSQALPHGFYLLFTFSLVCAEASFGSGRGVGSHHARIKGCLLSFACSAREARQYLRLQVFASTRRAGICFLASTVCTNTSLAGSL